ncbi:MAG: zinc-binding dehydrogenase [Anaerolineae bacterium]|nr:zinc-binding dehydrogenase [Anaerolineae bacterium]
MRAIVCSPSSPDRIEFREVAEPEPSRDEAVVAVRAVSLNRGNYRRLAWAEDGWRPGYDLAGEVLHAAADGSGPAVGTRVAGLVVEGAWAERVAVPTRRLAPLPDAVSFAQAAAVPVAGLTSLVSLAHGGLLLGKQVLITGAAGGVGRFAVQLARLAGARVTAQVGRPERTAGLQELGASEVVLTLDGAEPLFDLVIESIGGPLLGQALGQLAPGGVVVSIGASSDEPTTFDSLALVRKGGARWYALTLFQELELQGAGRRELETLLALVAEGRLDPQLDIQASWRDMGSLLRALGERRVAGKAVALID